MSSARDTRRSATFALGLVLLALTSHFARFLHELAVPHRLCAEHQRWEDGSRESAGETETRAPSYRSEQRAHESCPLGDCARLDAALDGPAPSVRGVLARTPSVESPSEESRRSIPLLLLAPKHSPPA